MSYILDALDKSEQERQSKQTPGINSVHRQPVATQKKALPWFPILIVLAIINGAGIYFWLQQNNTVEMPILSTAPINSEGNILVTLEKKPQQLAIVDPLVQASNTVTAPKKIKAYSLVNITDLPTLIRTEIQDLNFSTHLYGEDKDFRMVNINGEMIREGEDISDTLHLTEITEQGVILKYQQSLVEVSVLNNWQAN